VLSLFFCLTGVGARDRLQVNCVNCLRASESSKVLKSNKMVAKLCLIQYITLI